MDHLLSKEKVQERVMSEDLSVRFWKSDLPENGSLKNEHQ